MNSKQIEEAVELIYGNWNDRLPSTVSVKRAVLLPWQRALSDLDYDEVLAAVDALALSDTYMPRPALVRKKAIQLRSPEVSAPAPALAWSQVQSLSRAANSGTYDEGTYHPCVLETVRAMGGIASLSVSTNGDRSFFLEAYQSIVGDWEYSHYGVTAVN